MTLNKEELLKFKTNNDSKFLYNKINDFIDFIYQNDLYEYTDDNGIRDIIRHNIYKSGCGRIKYDYLIKENYDL